jgi:hypothetical protein
MRLLLLLLSAWLLPLATSTTSDSFIKNNEIAAFIRMASMVHTDNSVSDEENWTYLYGSEEGIVIQKHHLCFGIYRGTEKVGGSSNTGSEETMTSGMETALRDCAQDCTDCVILTGDDAHLLTGGDAHTGALAVDLERMQDLEPQIMMVTTQSRRLAAQLENNHMVIGGILVAAIVLGALLVRWIRNRRHGYEEIPVQLVV